MFHRIAVARWQVAPDHPWGVAHHKIELPHDHGCEAVAYYPAPDFVPLLLVQLPNLPVEIQKPVLHDKAVRREVFCAWLVAVFPHETLDFPQDRAELVTGNERRWEPHLDRTALCFKTVDVRAVIELRGVNRIREIHWKGQGRVGTSQFVNQRKDKICSRRDNG